MTADSRGSTAGAATLASAERAFRLQVIREALQRHQGNKAATARELGLTRRHLDRLLHDFAITRDKDVLLRIPP